MAGSRSTPTVLRLWTLATVRWPLSAGRGLGYSSRGPAATLSARPRCSAQAALRPRPSGAQAAPLGLRQTRYSVPYPMGAISGCATHTPTAQSHSTIPQRIGGVVLRCVTGATMRPSDLAHVTRGWARLARLASPVVVFSLFFSFLQPSLQPQSVWLPVRC